MQKTLILSLLILSFSSCKEEEGDKLLTNINSFAFGYSYGECIGSCTNTYLIEDNQLFQSSEPNYASCPSFDSYQQLADSSFQKIKSLTEFIPEKLWNEEEGAIGMPDAYDQGGYQVQITIDGQSKCWFIDTDKKNIPPYLHNFTEKLGLTLQEL